MVSLPWQTRVIFFTPTIADAPWEQATVGVYASWILIVLTLIAGSFTDWDRHAANAQERKRWLFLGIPVGLLLIISFFSSSPLATVLWGAHALLLAAFAWTLWEQQVNRHELMGWFVLSLMPHAVLGLWQFLVQQIDATSILGIAGQRAWTAGTSVVEFGEYRLLRAYGGFPHPNIFGGWLAVGIALLPELIRVTQNMRDKFLWIACLLLCGMALVFTFSRGAWLAAFIGCLLAFGIAWKRSMTEDQRGAIRLSFLMFVLVTTFSISSQFEAIGSRFVASERLERWSIEQRTTAFQKGFEAFMQRPVVGWGPGAVLMGISAVTPELASSTVGLTPEGSWVRWRASLEPPHMAPFVALLELGVIGLGMIIASVFFLLRYLLRTHQFMEMLPLLTVAGVLGVTDHYFWSLWAGQVLAMSIVIFCLARNAADKKEPRS